MKAFMKDCHVVLKEGVILNNGKLKACVIRKVSPYSEIDRGSIVLKNQNDNVYLEGCMVYMEDNFWDDINLRSYGLEEVDCRFD
jgi:hypothetical protein